MLVKYRAHNCNQTEKSILIRLSCALPNGLINLNKVIEQEGTALIQNQNGDKNNIVTVIWVMSDEE